MSVEENGIHRFKNFSFFVSNCFTTEAGWAMCRQGDLSGAKCLSKPELCGSNQMNILKNRTDYFHLLLRLCPKGNRR
jgi:hypothetical protein